TAGCVQTMLTMAIAHRTQRPRHLTRYYASPLRRHAAVSARHPPPPHSTGTAVAPAPHRRLPFHRWPSCRWTALRGSRPLHPCLTSCPQSLTVSLFATGFAGFLPPPVDI